MASRWGVVASLACGAAFAACHSSASSPGDAGTNGAAGISGGGDPSTPDGFCHGYYAILSHLYETCYGFPPSFTQKLLSEPTLCQCFDASIAAHRTSFDPAHAGACLTEIGAALTCDGFSSSAQAADCAAVAPLVPAGGTCRSFASVTIGLECAGGGYCRRNPNQSCDGTCIAPAAMGQPCSALDDVRCATGLVCDASSKTCVAPPTPGVAGAVCDNGKPCAKGLFCETSADAGSTASGTCQARRSSGPCRFSTDCERLLQCAGPDGARSCVAPKHVGDGCTPGQAECDYFTFCDASHKCSDAYAPVGQPCGPQVGSDNVPCTTGAYCDGAISKAGVCRVFKQAGDACTGTALFECGLDNAHCDATTHSCVACPY
jgi:hypothetical protein